jgi:hypothetical protein
MKGETQAKMTPGVRGVILMMVISKRRDEKWKTQDQQSGNFLLHLANGPSLAPLQA